MNTWHELLSSSYFTRTYKLRLSKFREHNYKGVSCKKKNILIYQRYTGNKNKINSESGVSQKLHLEKQMEDRNTIIIKLIKKKKSCKKKRS